MTNRLFFALVALVLLWGAIFICAIAVSRTQHKQQVNGGPQTPSSALSAPTARVATTLEPAFVL